MAPIGWTATPCTPLIHATDCARNRSSSTLVICLDHELPFNATQIMESKQRSCLNFYPNNATWAGCEQVVDWLANVNILDEQSRQTVLTHKSASLFLNSMAHWTKDSIKKVICLLNIRLNLAKSTSACDFPKPCSEYP